MSKTYSVEKRKAIRQKEKAKLLNFFKRNKIRSGVVITKWVRPLVKIDNEGEE